MWRDRCSLESQYRRRYPQYDHCAVLVAEQVTSRFLNVISLFNGALPLVAIQMQAFTVGDHVTLVFTTVLDELVRGQVEEDEVTESTDRAYWEARSSKAVVSLVDRMAGIVQEIDPSVVLKYNKFYIGLAKNDKPSNFVSFVPRKNHVILHVRVPKTDEFDASLEDAEIDMLDHYRGTYRLRIAKRDLASKSDLVKEFMRKAHTALIGS